MASKTVCPTVAALFSDLGVASTKTKAGWCLKEGLSYIYASDEGRLAPLIDRHGIPAFYSCLSSGKKHPCRHSPTQDLKDPSTCFQSLCRTITGQFVSGYAAQAAWKKLLTTTSHNLTPESVLRIVSEDDDSFNVKDILVESNLQKPVGITRGKARSIVDLAQHFQDGRLSEKLLTETEDESKLRKALLSVKGLGPWSCDMFLIFYLEKRNILPLGDLGVRKGIALHYELRGSLKGGCLCPKKDEAKMKSALSDYQPYSSLVAYYMWRAVDTPLMAGDEPKERKPATKAACSSPAKRERVKSEEEPQTPRLRRSIRRKVTP